MVISRFIIKSVLDSENKIILYHTRTTALITLDRQLYYKIFVEKDFSDSEIMQQLYNMGFIIDSHDKELAILDTMRIKEIDNPIQGITILPTTDCNARCFYCFEEGIERYSMSKETAQHTIEFIKNFYDDKELAIAWFGGEPLLNFPIIEFITLELKKLCYNLNTHITTNGSLLTREMLDFFVKNYTHTSFQITLDGVDEDYYKAKRYKDISPQDAFNRVMGSIKMILRSDLPIQVRVNFLPSKIEEAKQTYAKVLELLSDVDLSNLYLYMAPLNVKNDNEIISRFKCNGSEHPYLQLVKTQNAAGFPLNSIVYEKDNRLLGGFNLMPNCASCGIITNKRIIVDADGALYKCHRLTGRRDWATGNVIDGVDKNCYSYRYFTSPYIDEDGCKKCNILPICNGGCRANRILYGQNHKCHKIKQVQSELVRSYYDELKKSGK